MPMPAGVGKFILQGQGVSWERGTLPSKPAAQIPRLWQPGDRWLLSGAMEGPLIERLGDTDMEGFSMNQSGARPTNFREAYQYKTPPMLRASNWL